jgi:hypothetical protein
MAERERQPADTAARRNWLDWVFNRIVLSRTHLDVNEQGASDAKTATKSTLRGLRNKQLRRLALALIVKDATLFYQLSQLSNAGAGTGLIWLIVGPIATILVLVIAAIGWQIRIAGAPQ